MRQRDWDGARLHVVTGKGGTGKTTAAAALALALAEEGRHVLLTEVEERQGISQVLDVPPLPRHETRIAAGVRGGDVHGLSIEAEAALLEYLQLFYKLGRATSVLEKVGAVDFATTIAPGVRDVLLTGKVYEAVQRRPGRRSRSATGSQSYDAVVLDAPPTGRVWRFLNVAHEVSDIARVGPIRQQADAITELLRSEQTVVHVVTLLEQMPVQESLDVARELRAAGLRVGGIVVNQVRDAELEHRELEGVRAGTVRPETVAAHLASAGLRGNPAVVADLLQESRDLADRLELEEDERRRLTELERPLIELPLLTEGVGPDAVRELSWCLIEQGMA